MVWGLFPIDPLPGDERYYFFSKGTYKVGRRGCDITVNKDKGVSRIHAEILIDEMVCLDNPKLQSSKMSSKVRIRDCSKYGTFVNKNEESKEKVHEFPNKETALSDGHLVSFGTGNATYRFSFVPIVFFHCFSKAVEVQKPIQEKILSIGASTAQKWSSRCTHVLVDDSVPLTEELFDAIAAKRPFVSHKWVELISGKCIRTEIPSCSSYAPTLLLEEVSVKAADPQSRENCLNGYTFLLDSRDKYKLKERLQSLLEVCGGKVVSLEAFCMDSQGLEDEETKHVAMVIPTGSTANLKYSCNTKSLPNVKEVDLVSSVISGHLDPSIIQSPPVPVTSSCSTDETIVADSDAETETATSVPTSPAVHSLESSNPENKGINNVHLLDSVKEDSVEEIVLHVIESSETDRSENNTITRMNISREEIKEEMPCNSVSVNWSEVGSLRGLKSKDSTAGPRVEKEGPECGNVDIIYVQDLIVRDSASASFHSSASDPVLNFKRFRKMGVPSGNSFNNLIPFSKDPYKESDYGNGDVAESIKEEKKRKQMEAIAEDLFNYREGRKRGAAGSRRGFFARG